MKTIYLKVSAALQGTYTRQETSIRAQDKQKKIMSSDMAVLYEMFIKARKPLDLGEVVLIFLENYALEYTHWNCLLE